ncbi:AAA family ATPase [Hyphomicrobium sulfonivorans]|uniref:AAA family ATPase n=1 Tax=Hyphomicrobium sulfonivorans TaxID=121290 RepID=UPI0015709527|nr:AAA family ATPase [Hyphomicrobium sulfonivorans]MBI1649908.1 CtpF protein [Hyphomicrobium sulfonivorans]NSL72826.1 CtpF protein [Hyphomicrobium sulfonivorans]
MSEPAKYISHDDDHIGVGASLAELEDGFVPQASDRARPIPRISIQVFCENGPTADIVRIAAEDRRLAKAHVNVHMGGIEAAVIHYQQNPTPNLIVIESSLPRDHILAELDRLAENCDPGTKVIVIGHVNDITLYRELLKRGVSEYLVEPVTPLDLMEAVSNIYNNPQTEPVGHVYAFIGAKGGVGSSTVCHNTAFALSEALKADVVIADMDLAFGTTALDFNQDPMQGIADALMSPERLDEVLLDRLLTKCSDHLSIFAAPVLLDREYDISVDGCDQVIDVVRQNVPYVAVDLPHAWTGWVKSVLLQADEVVITAVPDLANLRNAKGIIDLLSQSRRNDAKPRLVMNMTNMPKRPEISVKEFEAAVGLKAISVIDFDSETFGQAANNGQMIEELSAKSKAAVAFRDIALAISNRRDVQASKKTSGFAPLLEKLKLKL